MKKIFTFVSILAVLILLAGCGTALNSAARKGDIAAVKELLNKGADPCEQWRGYDAYGINYTMYYTDEIYRVLINAAYEKINRGGSCPTNILYYAAYGGYNHIVEELLTKGYNVDAGWGNQTPLYAAAMGGQKHKETVKILLHNGADLDLAIEGLKDHAAGNAQYLDNASNREAYNNANKGIALLSQFKPRQMAQQTNVSQNITKEDLANIVKSAVEDAKKSQNKDIKTASAVQSDIDKPFFSTASKIMGDNDYAIIIGIEGYSSLPKSDYSYDDAKLVKDYLKALGVKERNIELLTDEKATLSGIMKSIEAWLP
ncbi:MAG: ankyrin repeat domain-containing protein, partial [Deltaproteobacteria bacterium]|nr:ankyrin repeat domain-containing protein [Deltaproteobacteria bacterium]